MKRRVFSFFVVCVIMVSMVPSNGATIFSDISSTDWFYNNVTKLVEDDRSIIKGYPDGSFKPLNQLTKDQFITMVVRASGYNLPNSEGYWAQNNIDKAMELGYIFYGEFDDYKGVITREEMSHIIVRVVTHLDGGIGLGDIFEVNDVVVDSGKFTPKYEQDIQKTYKLGIITGYPDYTFRPQGVLTRSEASAVIIRVIDKNERIAFDYDKLLAGIESLGQPEVIVEEHLLGGEKWVDPTTQDILDRVEVDQMIVQSDLKVSPTKTTVEMGIHDKSSVDAVMGSIEYNSEGALQGQVEDFKYLLLRRLPLDEVGKVMEYLNEKKTDSDKLQHEETLFYLDNNRYLVRLIYSPNTKGYVRLVSFNIWFRDESFIDNEESKILFFMDYEDYIIFR